MIKIRKAGVWSNISLYKRRTAGAWVDVLLGKRRDAGAGTFPIYYERIILDRPPEGNYTGMGVLQFLPSGDVKVGPRYHDAITQVIGRWRLSGVTPGVSDTVQVKVEKYLDQGDLEPGYTSTLNSWLPLYPGSYTYTYSSNNGGAAKAVLKVTLKDQNARELIFYAEVVYGGTGRIDYDPIDWSAGGGGGGSGCVAIESYMPDGRLAQYVLVGDQMEVVDESSLISGIAEVSYSQRKILPGYRITTESGVSLRCSSSAPIPTRDGLVLSPDLLGNQVFVRRDAIDSTLCLETVISVEPIGDIEVQHITVEDLCFWAGESPGAFILHHNKPPIGGLDP